MESINSLDRDNRKVVDAVIEKNALLKEQSVGRDEASAKIFSHAIAVINRKKITDPKKQKKIFDRVLRNSKGR